MMSFSLSGGVEVYGFIAPTEITDEYPVIDPLYGIDGFRNVDTLNDLNNIPNLRRRAGMVVGIGGGTQYYKLNPGPWNGTITDWTIFNSGGGGGTFTGGTVTGPTIFTNGLTANTLTVNGVSITGDTYTTGGTYSNGTIDFYYNTGGGYQVTGITDNNIYTTGFTYSANTFYITDTSGNTFSATINTMTGLTVNGNLTVTGTTSLQGFSATTISATTIGSSGDCVDDIYVSNIHSCSPLNINPLNEGNVYFGSTSGVTFDLINNKVGIGITNPTAKLHLSGNSIFEQSKLTINQKNSIIGIDIVNSGESMYQLTNSVTDWCIVGKTPSEFYFYNSLNVPIRFYTNASEKMTVLGNGNVGIGTSTPTEKLDVNGKTKTTNLQVTSGATAGYVLTALDNSGNTQWVALGSNNNELDPVLTITGTTPSTVNIGDRFLISGGTGIWSGRTNQIAEYTGVTPTDYSYYIPVLDDVVFVTDTLTTYRFDGTNWISWRGTAILQNGNSLTTSVNIGSNNNQNLTLRTSGQTRVTISGSTGDVGIGTTTPLAKLDVSSNGGRLRLSQNIIGNVFNGIDFVSYVGGVNGSLISNQFTGELRLYTGPTYFPTFYSSGNETMRISTSGNVGIGTTTPQARLHVAGTNLMSAATQNVLTVIGSGNTNSFPIFSVQGSQGELFSVTDSLTGSLFSVNDISGLPVIEVFSDDTILMGSFDAPSLNTTTRVFATTGTTNVYSISTSGYTGAFFDYTVSDGTNLRAGNIMSVWSGSSVNYTETQTTDFGNTSGLTFNMVVSSGNAILRTSGTTGNWTVKTIVRSI
jgi:hypothetical protein